GQLAGSGQDPQALEHVVVPVGRVVELDPFGMNDAPRAMGAEESMSQQELGRPSRRFGGGFVSSGTSVFAQAPQRRDAFMEGRVGRFGPLVAVPPSIGPL